MVAEIRVDTLGESDTFVVHIENTVVVFEEVDTEVCLTSIASRRDLQDTMTIAVDHVLVLTNNIIGLFNGESEIWHRIELLNCAVSTPKADWIQLWLTSSILLVHDAE